MIDIKLLSHNIPYEVYLDFYKEIGCKNVCDAIKKVGAKKDFQTAFKKSNAYLSFLESFKIEKRKRLQPKPYVNPIKDQDVENINIKIGIGQSLNSIARELGLTHTVFRHALKKHPVLCEVKYRRYKSSCMENSLAELKLQVKNGANLTQLAKYYGVHLSTVSKFLKENKIILKSQLKVKK